MFLRAVILVCTLLAASASAQVGSIPPNAIDRAMAVDDMRRASAAQAGAADRERAARDARDNAVRSGPPPQSTMADRVSGLNGSLNPSPTAARPAPPITNPD